VLAGGKLVAVANAGCKIGGIMMMVRSAMAIEPILGTQYRLISSSWHPLVNITVATPGLVIPIARDKHSFFSVKNTLSQFSRLAILK
jgi:hypothetical protein